MSSLTEGGREEGRERGRDRGRDRGKDGGGVEEEWSEGGE